LQAHARYRYIDTKHLTLLTGLHYKNLVEPIRELYDAGLINRLENNKFGRDRLKDPQVSEITDVGWEYLETNNALPTRADWLGAGNYKNPVHNLDLCLATASAEIAFKEKFIAWGDVLARAPEPTRKLEHPYVFGHKVIDNLFVLDFPKDYVCIFLELDLSNHGEKEYREKYELLSNIIYKGEYKRRFGMAMNAYVLTITDSPGRMQNLQSYMPARNNCFLFKAHPEYGKFNKAPAPAPEMFTDFWFNAKGKPIKLEEIV